MITEKLTHFTAYAQAQAHRHLVKSCSLLALIICFKDDTIVRVAIAMNYEHSLFIIGVGGNSRMQKSTLVSFIP